MMKRKEESGRTGGYTGRHRLAEESVELGQPLRIRSGEEEAASLIAKAGFKTEAVKEAGLYHYMITARP